MDNRYCNGKFRKVIFTRLNGGTVRGIENSRKSTFNFP